MGMPYNIYTRTAAGNDGPLGKTIFPLWLPIAITPLLDFRTLPPRQERLEKAGITRNSEW